MTTYSFLPLVACGGSLVMQAVAARTQFVSPSRISVRSKIIGLAFAVFGFSNLYGLSLASAGYAPVAVGLLLYGLANWVFWAACRANRERRLSIAFTPDEPMHLMVSRVYRFIRHPFYTSYCLTWLAGAVAARSFLLLGEFAAMAAIYYCAARFEERKFAQSTFAEAYRTYRKGTGMFGPRIKLSLPGNCMSRKNPGLERSGSIRLSTRQKTIMSSRSSKDPLA